MGDPRSAQKCKYCEQAAAQSLIWAEGRAYVPVCMAHVEKARTRLRKQGEGVDDIVQVSTRPVAYRESRMDRALQPPPVYEHDDMEQSFGRRVGGERSASLQQEAPIAPIGRASSPRGATIQTRSSGSRDIMRVSDRPIRRIGKGSREINKRSSGPIGYISNKVIPDNVLQMLGTDWKSLKATRTSDNRVSMSIDGVRFSVYTRRG